MRTKGLLVDQFVLISFYKNANDSEMERSGIELNGCMALIAYAGISVSQIYLGKHCSFCFRRSEASC